ncbi:MAG TPA: pyruvoyl-dependent arginine decarboxylase [Mycobacteriales bacterium]|nr:pyruvoyl-dependent arginine decarboxylase [Mycobacteriales bacterium]
MRIAVSSAVGTGPTALAAFDHALYGAGVANFNLLALSSVVPPGAEIVEERPDVSAGTWGDRLYVVMAEQRVVEHNVEAWAGIGWVQDPDGGRGLFVEHHGNSERAVCEDITASLKALMITRGVDWEPIRMSVVGDRCENDPICALVVATFKSESWTG